jgi:hypothetical protein
MKIANKVFVLGLLLTGASQATTTITGTTGSAFKDKLGTNIAAGSLVMLVAANSGSFLTSSAQGAVVPGLSGLTGNTITPQQANFTAGSLFGGNAVFAVSTAGASGSIGGFAGFDNTLALNKKFALVWFSQTSAQLTTSSSGAYFGMMSLSDWLLPADAEGKSYTLSSTDSGGATSFYSTSVATTATQIGGGFFTGSGTAANTGSTALRSAQFQIVPEPSAALLGALGALGLLRRRRN